MAGLSISPVTDGVVVAELDRGPDNLWSLTDLRELVALLEAPPEGAHVLRVRSVGEAFCRGRERGGTSTAPGVVRGEAETLVAVTRAFRRTRLVTVAEVQGDAAGFGVGVLAACDVAVASASAAFALSEVRFGILPAVISPFVVRAIGGRQARRYFLTAEHFGAEEARRIGLVHEVAEPDALEARVGEVVGELLKGGPEALREAKRLVRLVEAMPQGGSLLAEATVGVIAERRASDEGREGINAFLEKRPAGWLQGS